MLQARGRRHHVGKLPAALPRARRSGGAEPDESQEEPAAATEPEPVARATAEVEPSERGTGSAARAPAAAVVPSDHFGLCAVVELR